jgi:chromosome segregation ATPase
MTHTELIIAPEISAAPPAPIINEEGAKLKAELLVQSNHLVVIPDASTRDFAIKVAGHIAGHISQVEKDRKAIKDPFFRMGQAIDKAAADHVKELEAEKRRLNQLVGAYNAEQEMIAQRELEAREREARRIQQEAAEAQRKAEAEAERLRKEQEARALKQKQAQDRAEAAGKELTAKAKAAQLQAQLDAEERAEAIEAARKEQQEATDRALRQLESEKLAAAEKLRQEKATGGAQRTEIDIEVLDILALYKARPDCVRLSPDLVQLKYVINNSDDPNLRIPGITWTKRAVFSAKAR